MTSQLADMRCDARGSRSLCGVRMLPCHVVMSMCGMMLREVACVRHVLLSLERGGATQDL